MKYTNRDRIINRAINFIENNTVKESSRIGTAIVEELKLIKNDQETVNKQYTHEDKINWMRIAAGIAGFGFKNEQLDLLVSLYELVLEKGGKAAIDDVVKIEHNVDIRAAHKAKQDALDKVSENK